VCRWPVADNGEQGIVKAAAFLHAVEETQGRERRRRYADDRRIEHDDSHVFGVGSPPARIQRIEMHGGGAQIRRGAAEDRIERNPDLCDMKHSL